MSVKAKVMTAYMVGGFAGSTCHMVEHIWQGYGFIAVYGYFLILFLIVFFTKDSNEKA